MRISVVGLGKLGAPIAAVLAAKGFEVVGIDLIPAAVEKVEAGISPVEEPGLQDLLTAHRARLSATTDWSVAIGSTDITFIIVPTPSGPDGTFKNDHILTVMDHVGKALRAKTGYHLVVVNSTTMPGSMNGVVRTRLEQVSGRTVGSDLGLCYNPEFIALGEVIKGLLHPDFVLIGESDAHAGDLLQSICRGVVGDETPIARMNLVNAEISKIAVNTYVTTKISFANMLSEICDRFEGGDVEVVTGTIGRDSRIGAKYLRGATAYGGPCFPRDTIAFAAMAHNAGVEADLAIAADAINARQSERLCAIVRERVRKGARVAILGLAYKAGTPVIECSPGIMFAAALAQAGYKVVVHDPMALDPARSVLQAEVGYAASAREAIEGVDGVIVATPWPEYRGIDPAWFLEPRCLVIDCWRILPEHIAKKVELIYLGRNDRDGGEVSGRSRRQAE
jgi:UDPglucose 6-dehydrogenase